MFRPPSTIHIKRKATDDPVDVLRVHELNGKRQRRATEFVFTRQPSETPSTATTPAAPQLAPRGTRRIKPLPRSGVSPSRDGQPVAVSGKHAVVQDQNNQPTEPDVLPSDTATALDNTSELTPSQIAAHRRFHISRTTSARGRQSPVIGGKVQKRAPTVFIERRAPQSASREETSTTQPTSTNQNTSTTAQVISTPSVPITTTLSGSARPQKKPGLAARTSSKLSSLPTSANLNSAAGTPSRNVRLPSGLVMPWDVSSDKLAKELEAYTLQEIGRAMADSTPESSNPPLAIPTRLKKAPSKFKPKKPALRYHERHPEAALPSTGMDIDFDTTDDEGEYIIDTYIRIPADEVESDPKSKLGFLVIESDEAEEFYEEDSENSDPEDYDEEDENAENHYSADYPEEEVESDDEYGREAYRYRTKNASDDEEFDENDYDPEDDDNDTDGDDATRYPWSKPRQPAWMKDSDEEDIKEIEEDEDTDKDEVVVAAAHHKDPLADLFGGLSTTASRKAQK